MTRRARRKREELTLSMAMDDDSYEVGLQPLLQTGYSRGSRSVSSREESQGEEDADFRDDGDDDDSQPRGARGRRGAAPAAEFASSFPDDGRDPSNEALMATLQRNLSARKLRELQGDYGGADSFEQNEHEEPDEEEGGGDDSYGSRVDLRPHRHRHRQGHHKHRKHGHKDRGDKGRRSSRREHESGSDADAGADDAAPQEREAGRHHASGKGRERRRKAGHASETDEGGGGGTGKGWSGYLSSRSDQKRRSSRSRHSRRRKSQGGGLTARDVVGYLVGFFDGVSFKTVLVCIMGMTIVVKLNPPSHPHHEEMMPAGGVRGTMVNSGGNVGWEGGGGEGGQPMAAVATDGLVPSVPPPPPVDQQQQPQPPAQGGYAPQPPAQPGATPGGYAVGGQSTYSQSPLQPEAPPQPVAAAAVPQADVPPADPAGAVPLVPAPVPGAAVATGAAVTEGSLLPLLDNFKDNWDPYEKTDIPMFWHIPKAGGSSIKDTMGGCHRFVQATEFGVTDGHDQDTQVAIVYPAVPGVADTDRSPFVNIDSTTVAGIQRAKSMGFADANLAQLVVSPFVFETNDLFTPTAKGRLFSVFRHPIERAVSMFYYIRVADWEPSYKPELKDWTLEQYAQSDVIENNWMTRQLSNQLGGELTEENLKKAMEVVRTKFLVGLMSQIEPTMARVEKFFRMTYHVNPPNQEACRERLMSGGANSNAANKKPLAEGDPAWEMLAQQNNFDLPLYKYIEQLFQEQEAFVTGLPDEFRKVGGTCCKCDPPTFPPEGFTCPQAVKNEG